MLRIGIDPEQLSDSSCLNTSIHGNDDQTGPILYANDPFALHIAGAILEEMRKPDHEWRTDLIRHLAEALTVHSLRLMASIRARSVIGRQSGGS
jgi:AraC family transcriptional regulator